MIEGREGEIFECSFESQETDIDDDIGNCTDKEVT